METDEFKEIEDKYIDPIEPYFTLDDFAPEEVDFYADWNEGLQVDSKIK